MNKNRCEKCEWRSDDFSSVCVNGESPHRADFVDRNDCCDVFKAKRDDDENRNKTES